MPKPSLHADLTSSACGRNFLTRRALLTPNGKTAEEQASLASKNERSAEHGCKDSRRTAEMNPRSRSVARKQKPGAKSKPAARDRMDTGCRDRTRQRSRYGRHGKSSSAAWSVRETAPAGKRAGKRSSWGTEDRLAHLLARAALAKREERPEPRPGRRAETEPGKTEATKLGAGPNDLCCVRAETKTAIAAERTDPEQRTGQRESKRENQRISRKADRALRRWDLVNLKT
jgi:hypothetical protein